MKEFHWCNFEWDARVFPDPKGMLERLHQKGLKICVWINPYIAQRSALFDEGMEHGYLLKRSDGSVWQWDRWQSGMGADGASPTFRRSRFHQSRGLPLVRGQAAAHTKRGLTCRVGAGRDGRGHVQDRRPTFRGPTKRGDGERIPTDVVYHDGVVYQVFALDAGAVATAQVPALDCGVGATFETTIEARRVGTQIEVTVESVSPTGRRQPWSLLLRGVETVVSVTGGRFASNALGTHIAPEPGVQAIIVHL